MTFKEKLKQECNKQGMDFEIAQKVYMNIFRVVYRNILMNTHNYDLYKTQVRIKVPMFGHFLTKKRHNIGMETSKRSKGKYNNIRLYKLNGKLIYNKEANNKEANDKEINNENNKIDNTNE